MCVQAGTICVQRHDILPRQIKPCICADNGSLHEEAMAMSKGEMRHEWQLCWQAYPFPDLLDLVMHARSDVQMEARGR